MTVNYINLFTNNNKHLYTVHEKLISVAATPAHMKQTVFYKDHFTKADVMELYAKTMTNLGPLNPVNVKSFDYNGNGMGKGMGGFHLINYSFVPDAYVAVQLMTSEEPQSCKMERFSFGTRRAITLENHDEGGLEVTIEGSVRGNACVKRLCDSLFNVNEEELAMAKAIVAFIKNAPTNT